MGSQTSRPECHNQLTGALNRHGLEEKFTKEATRAPPRHDTTLCVSLIGIDNIKKPNDSIGHETGDEALILLTNTCYEMLRPQNTAARYGGQEFIIHFPEISLDDAGIALIPLQRELTKRFFLHVNEKVLITFSASVTQLQPEGNGHSHQTGG